MGDPLADPRATDLLTAEPAEVWALAATFRQVGDNAHGTAAGLRSAQPDATWTGAAASAFRRKLGPLPGELDKIARSYGDVAGALTSYETELASVQPTFQRLAQQLGTARSSLAGAQGQLATAQGNLSQALGAPNAKPSSPAVQSAHTAYLGAVGTVGRLQGEVGGLESQGFALLDRFQHARDACHGKVSSACGIAPHQSWWDSVLGDVGNFMSGVGHFAWGVVKGIGEDVIHTPGAFWTLVTHPSWKAFETFAKDLAVTASVALLFTGVGELLLPEESAGAAFLDGASNLAGGAVKGATYAEAYGQSQQGEQDLLHGDLRAAGAQFASAALGVGLMHAPELGGFLPASKAADAAAERSNVLQSFLKSVQTPDGSAIKALSGLSKEDRGVVLKAAGWDAGQQSLKSMPHDQVMTFLSNILDPTAMTAKAARSAQLLDIASLPAKTAVNFGADKFVIDPANTAAKKRIDHALGVPAGG